MDALVDERWAAHNLHLEDVDLFAKRDPTLRRLAAQPLRHESPLLAALPVSTPGIVTLVGGRQVGKTTLVKQLMLRLLTAGRVPAAQVTFVTGEVFRDGDELRRVLADLVAPNVRSGKLRYLLVDEVTYVPGWDRAIKFLADAGALERTFLLVTGSDLVLIEDAMKRLPGRRGRAREVDFHLYPLSFVEFCRLRRQVPAAHLEALAEGWPEADLPAVPSKSLERLEAELLLYQVTGGYLTAINDLARDGQIAAATLRIYADWLRGDMLRLDRSEAYLREVLSAIDARYGSQVTWNALARDLSIDHPKTIADYCGLLERMDAVRIVPALQEHTLGPAPKKARKLYFADPFIHHAVRAWLAPVRRDALDPRDVAADERLLGAEIEATIVTQLARAFPTFYVKAEGEVDAAYLRGRRFWPIEVKWTGQLRPKDLKQVRKYRNGLIAGRVRSQHRIEQVHVLPAPVVLLRIASRC